MGELHCEGWTNTVTGEGKEGGKQGRLPRPREERQTRSAAVGDIFAFCGSFEYLIDNKEMRIRYERAALERAVQELKRLICREPTDDGL